MKSYNRPALTLGLLLLIVVVAAIGMLCGHHLSHEGLLAGTVGASAGAAITEEQFKKIEDTLGKKVSDAIESMKRAIHDETSKVGTITGKTNEKLEEVSTEAKKAGEALTEAKKLIDDIKTRVLDLEQKGANRPGGPSGDETKTAGQLFVESDGYKAALSSGRITSIKSIDGVKIGNAQRKTAIINAQGQNQPLVQDMRVPGIVAPQNRRLTIRDLLPQQRTTSNLVQFTQETAFTNNAGIQFSSPNDKENVAKPESALTFALANAPVETIAHFIPASRQVLADAVGLQDYIDLRLMYGLKLYEELQMLKGDGSPGHLNGINTQATAFNRGVSNDTMMDTLLKAMLQVYLSEYPTSGFILNPVDWTTIQLAKDTQGRYIFSNPQAANEARMWGVPVVATNSQTVGGFTAGAFDLAGAIWDREDAEVRVSEEYQDFFVKNMVAILCEERTCLIVYRPTSFVYGTLPALGT